MSGHTVPKDQLICLECMLTCPCDIYAAPQPRALEEHVPHVHLAGGDARYPLCAPCQARWRKRHFVGNRWLDECAEGCVYDLVRATVPFGQGLGEGKAEP